MVLTATQCQQQIRHTLGGELSNDLDPLRVTNEAGRWLATMHAWKWLETTEAHLDLRANVAITGAEFDVADNGEGNLHFSKTDAFLNYTWSDGDTLEITAGTNMVAGHYRVTKKVDKDAVLLEKDASSTGTGTLTGVSATLHASAIILPADFRELLSYSTTSGLLTGLALTSYQDLIDRKQSISTHTSGYYYGAIAHPSPVGSADSVGAPVPRLEIYPAPGANATGAIRIFYRSDWTDLTSDSELLRVPAYVETLFLQVLRAFARGYEEEDQGSLTARLLEIGSGPLFSTAVVRDGEIQPDYGPLKGGLTARARQSDHGFSLNFNTLAD